MDIYQFYFELDRDRIDDGPGAASESRLQDALKELEPLMAMEPEKYASRCIRLLNKLAGVFAAQNKFNNAGSCFSEALALAEQRVGGVEDGLAKGDHAMEQQVGMLEGEDPRVDLVHVLTGQALLYSTMGQPDMAEAGLQRALGIVEGLGEDRVAVDDAAGVEGLGAVDDQGGKRQEDRYDRERAMILKNLGDLQTKKGDLTGARAYYQRMAALYERLSARQPGYSGRMAQALTDLGIVAYQESRYSEAGSFFARAQEIYEPLAAADPETYEAGLSTVLNFQAAMAWKENDSPAVDSTIARISHMKVLQSRFSPRQGPACAEIFLNLGACYARKKDFAGARDAYLQVLEIYGQLDGINPGVYLPARASVLHVQGSLYRDFGHLREAATKYGRSIEIRRKLAVDYPSVHEPPLARVLHSLGKLYITMEEKRQAILTFGEAAVIYERLAAAAPTLYEAELSLVYLNMGICMMEKGDPAGAQSALEKALLIARRLVTADPGRHERTLVVGLQQLAYMQAYDGQYREAQEKYQEALQIKETYRSLRPDRYEHEVARIYRDMGRAWLRERAFGQAAEALAKALEMYKALESDRPGTYGQKIEDVLTLLEKTFADPGDPGGEDGEEPTLEALQQQLAVYAELEALHPGDRRPRHAAVLNALAFAWEEAEKPDEAIPARLQAQSMYEALIADGSTDYLSALAESLFWLAILYERHDNPSAAEEAYRRCLEVYDRVVEEEGSAYHPRIANVLMYYAKFLLGRGETAAGQELIDRASVLAGGNVDAVSR